MADFPYRRLPGGRRGVLRGASLWLGSDHILAVKNLRVSEEYKRYYLKDIQAVILRKAPRFGFSVWVMGGFVGSLVAALILYFTRFALEYDVALALIWIFAGYMAYISFFRSCVCHVQTAVSLDELPSLHRIGSAWKAIDEIAGHARAAQGELVEDWIPQLETREAQMLETQAGTSVQAPEQGIAVAGVWGGVPISCWIAVGSMFLGAVLDWRHVGSLGNFGKVANYAVFLGSMVAVATALIQTLRRKGTRAVRVLMIVLLGFLGVELYTTTMVPSVLQAVAIAQGRRNNTTRALTAFNRLILGGEVLLGVVGSAVLLMNGRGQSE